MLYYGFYVEKFAINPICHLSYLTSVHCMLPPLIFSSHYQNSASSLKYPEELKECNIHSVFMHPRCTFLNLTTERVSLYNCQGVSFSLANSALFSCTMSCVAPWTPLQIFCVTSFLVFLKTRIVDTERFLSIRKLALPFHCIGIRPLTCHHAFLLHEVELLDHTIHN